MTAVHLRRELDTDAKFLADVPFDQLDNVIPTIKSWGMEDEDVELVGQFVLTERAAYFEVVIVDQGGE